MKILAHIASLGICMTVAVLFSSCCLFTGKNYNVGFRNIGTHNLFVTSGIIENYAPTVALNPRSYKDSGSLNGIPESVTIKWKKESGEIIERKVRLKENLLSRFGNNDTIVFNINDNDEVILSFERHGDKPVSLPSPDDKAK